MFSFPAVCMSEEYANKIWEYRPFVDRVERLLSGIWESSGKGYRFMHSYRVFQLIDQMRHYTELEHATDINWPLLRIAGLCHDLGLIKVEREMGRLDIFDDRVITAWIDKHAGYATEIIRAEFADLLTEEELEQVCFLAAQHSNPDVTDNIVLRILQDADNLDERGLILLWRMSAVASNHDLSIGSQFNFYFQNRQAMWQETMGKLHFESSRQTALRRMQNMDQAMLTFAAQFHALDLPYTAETFPWLLWQSRIEEAGWEIDRPKGSAHPTRADIIYPLDYGYVPGHLGWDGMEQDIFVGDRKGPLTGILLSADFRKGDREFKLLWGMSDRQMQQALDFYNTRPTEMVAWLVRRP